MLIFLKPSFFDTAEEVANVRLDRRVVSIHRVAEKKSSGKLGFRCKEFSETQHIPLLILLNPICRGISIPADRGYAQRVAGIRDSRKPGLPYARRLFGSCKSTPGGREHYQHDGEDKAYGLYCDKGFESAREHHD
jgi:hypothetical protein